MRNVVCALLCLLITVSCVEKLIKEPEVVIPREKMIAIMKEMAIMNAARTTNIVILKEHGVDPTTHVFDKYDIDSATYVENDTYYASMPVEYVAMFEEVESLLLEQQADEELKKEINDSLKLIDTQKERRRRDSIAGRSANSGVLQ